MILDFNKEGSVSLKLHHFFCFFILGSFILYYESAIAKDEGHSFQRPSLTNFEEKIVELRKSYLMGEYQAVVDLSKRLMILDSSNEEIKDLYALAIFKLKNYRAVIELYSERQADYLESPLQLKLRSIALAKEKSFLSAMTNLRTLKSIAPLSPEWKVFYHYLVFKINPKSSFKELERMNKGSPQIANDLTAGKLFLLYGKNDEATKAFESGLEKDPSNVEALENLGDSYLKNKKFDKSISNYSRLLSIEPQNFKVKLKLAKSYIKKGQLISGMKVLEADNNTEIVKLRGSLLSYTNNLLNNPQSRSIAEEKIQLNSVTVSEEKSVLEEKFIPKDIDIYVDPALKGQVNNAGSLQTTSVNESVRNKEMHSDDISMLELSIGAKAKKYVLTGAGFNARADYSTGISLNSKYTFFPAGRSWNSQIIMNHSRIEISDLRGLSPSKATLSESRLGLGVNYLVRHFSIGPVLMYENMSATQTTPSVIRGNVNFFNLGIKSEYSIHIKKNSKLNFEVSYLSKVMSVSKTTSVGTADRRNLMDASVKFYYEMRPLAYYFIGLGFLETKTKYSASSARGTAQAIEKETEFTFPIGINYAF